MKNIQVIDGALNCAYDIFATTDDEYALIFPAGTDVAFIDEVVARHPKAVLDPVFARLWKRRLPKAEALGIHGLLFYELDHKKRFYPTRRDEEAVANITPPGAALSHRKPSTTSTAPPSGSGRRVKRGVGA